MSVTGVVRFDDAEHSMVVILPQHSPASYWPNGVAFDNKVQADAPT